MNLKIMKNKDLQKFEEISSAVLNNDGYCPCMIEKNGGTKCICDEFKNQQIAGLCRCGRYEKIEKLV